MFELFRSPVIWGFAWLSLFFQMKEWRAPKFFQWNRLHLRYWFDSLRSSLNCSDFKLVLIFRSKPIFFIAQTNCDRLALGTRFVLVFRFLNKERSLNLEMLKSCPSMIITSLRYFFIGYLPSKLFPSRYYHSFHFKSFNFANFTNFRWLLIFVRDNDLRQIDSPL